MKLCGGLLPLVTSTIILLLLNFGKVVHGHCSDKKFYYELPNRPGYCGMCRICPHEVLDNPRLYEEHLQEQCRQIPALPDGRLAHCHSISFDKPSCEKWIPHNGKAVCSDDNAVYSTCFLKCSAGYTPSEPTNITCIDQPQPHWDHQFTHCIGEGDDAAQYTVVIVLLVTVILGVVILVVVVFICVRKKSSAAADIDVEEQVAPPAVKNVSIVLTNATRRCYKLHRWSAGKGSTVSVMAHSSGCGIQYLVLLKQDSKTGDPGVYSSKPDGPNQVDLVNVDHSHQGSYHWIVRLTDGVTERGHFKLVVKRHLSLHSGLCPPVNIPVALHNAAGQHPVSSDDEAGDRLSFSQPGSVETCGQAVPDTTLVLVTTATEDQEQLQAPQTTRGSMEGYARLMQTREDVHTLCRLLDREEQDGHASWHVIITSPLLGYDRDFVSFLEYHRKGKMYDGPMFHTLTLMKQNGTTVEELIQLLQQYQPSSTKAIAVLEKYL